MFTATLAGAALSSSQPLQAWPLTGAQTLRVRRPGRLRVTQGRIWLTVDGEAKDRVLQAGDSLLLQRGHRMVIEAWSPQEGARLAWEGADSAVAAAALSADGYILAAPTAQHSTATRVSCVRSGSQAPSPR